MIMNDDLDGLRK